MLLHRHTVTEVVQCEQQTTTPAASSNNIISYKMADLGVADRLD